MTNPQPAPPQPTHFSSPPGHPATPRGYPAQPPGYPPQPTGYLPRSQDSLAAQHYRSSYPQPAPHPSQYRQAPYADAMLMTQPQARIPAQYYPVSPSAQRFAPVAGGPPNSDPTDVVGARIGQYLLDGLLVGATILVTFLVVSGLSRAAVAGMGRDALPLVYTLLALFMVVCVVAGWVVHAFWPHRHDGQTPAMGWMKLRIVSEQGGQPGLGALSARWALLVVDGFAGGLVGLATAMSSARHQRLGDMVAKTVVVRAD